MIRAIAIGLMFVLSACAGNAKVELTPLELQALQTREYETQKDLAFASVISVFQDLGYTIESADKETGFITAYSASDTRTDFLFTGNRYISQTKATAFVEPIMDIGSRVRLNFVTGVESSAWYGQRGKKDTPILDPLVYQTAFEKIETAIFMRSE